MIREAEAERFSIEAWQPRTKIGIDVKGGKIVSIEQIFASGKPIKEVEIVDALLPNLENKMLEVASVQRMTKNNRRQKYRATVVVGDRHGHVGIGTSKDVEVRPAIDAAIRDAKLKIISVPLGCGSWECNCGTNHSLPLRVTGKCGTSEVVLKPAPRGVGIVANAVVKAVVELAGVSDVWSFSRGRTRDIYNTAIAAYEALRSITELKNIESLNAGSAGSAIAEEQAQKQ